ncbi:hypothetical protein [uncultured Thiohalocapsa sp.]|uniref:hypothetical protein n=1 Tax=uncultured Thiohalocapsa sp. TaxID=768990 RepID=UPI0025CE3B97|nr:hypothetical protein [uncultured Thiohalocapsa sp.]
MGQNRSGAASTRASISPPSIDLVALLQAVTASVLHRAEDTADRPLFAQHGRRIIVDTGQLIKRLSKAPEFRSGFGAGDGAGFLRDIVPPSKGQAERVGGHIHGEGAAALTAAIRGLEEAVGNALGAAVPNLGQAAEGGQLPTGENYLKRLAQALGLPFQDDGTQPFGSVITPLEFVDSTQVRPRAERERDVARVIAAIEEVDSSDWIDHLAKPLFRQLERADLDADEIEGIVDGLREEAGREGSQAHRMQRFIGDDALSRARLDVGLAIMGAIRDAVDSWSSDPSASLLAGYVERVTRLREGVLSGDVELAIDASAALGSSARTTLYDQLVKVGFLRCLPVWPEPVTQLFELRSAAPQGERMVRDASYRFRINGTIPDRGRTIFGDRIARLRAVLEADDGGGHPRLGRHLAELVFLLAVIPDGSDAGDDPQTLAGSLVTRVASGDRSTLLQLVNELASRERTVERIANCLIKALREKGSVIVDRAQQRARELWICVKKNIIDWERLSASVDGRDVFARPEGGSAQDEQALWYRSVAVTTDPASEPDVLFSVKASYSLRERTLCMAAGSESWMLQGERDLKEPVLPILIGPTGLGGASKERLNLWSQGAEVVVGIDETWLRRQRGRQKGPAPDHQFAASVTATALIVYVVLRVLRARFTVGESAPRTLILRMQSEGRGARRDEDLFAGSHGLFAVAQAVEQVLGIDAPVFMQGLALDVAASELRWQQGGTFSALKSAFPIRLGHPTQTSGSPVALVSYSTRPCGRDPAGHDGDQHVFGARTYLAVSSDALGVGTGPGLHLAHVRNLVHVQSAREFENPTILLEEIARLYSQGCRHIMLLWNHFGARRIGRGANRHAPHANRRFLGRLAQEFPDATVYTLSLDVFQATRVTSRRDLVGRHAFEVSRVREHEAFWDDAESGLRDELIAFYTFATLSVVGDEQRRPQSGFCTYFLESSARAGEDLEWSLAAQTNLIGQNRDPALRDLLLAVLRGMHYLHAEREPKDGQLRPCLAPHHWSDLGSAEAAGEVVVMRSRRRGDVVLSLPAVLARVGAVLRAPRAA